jgi:hypothetical protein
MKIPKGYRISKPSTKKCGIDCQRANATAMPITSPAPIKIE